MLCKSKPVIEELNFKMIGNRIKERRIELSLTQEYIAGLLDVNPSHVSNIENGHARPSLIILVKIANILNCSIDRFLGTEYFYGGKTEVSSFPIEKQIELALSGKSQKVKEQILSIINIL